ncbi:hypothetical protein C5167_041674 [Papaver somniferum]|nr:hypothetical protein C5167_041674 [Papaver somniferum]
MKTRVYGVYLDGETPPRIGGVELLLPIQVMLMKYLSQCLTEIQAYLVQQSGLYRPTGHLSMNVNMFLHHKLVRYTNLLVQIS